MSMLKRFLKDEAGLETIEYVIMASLVLLGAVIGYATLSGKIQRKFAGIDVDGPAIPSS